LTPYQVTNSEADSTAHASQSRHIVSRRLLSLTIARTMHVVLFHHPTKDQHNN
jgi:hypothetical protein